MLPLEGGKETTLAFHRCGGDHETVGTVKKSIAAMA
jgi:hypothetical protein